MEQPQCTCLRPRRAKTLSLADGDSPLAVGRRNPNNVGPSSSSITRIGRYHSAIYNNETTLSTSPAFRRSIHAVTAVSNSAMTQDNHETITSGRRSTVMVASRSSGLPNTHSDGGSHRSHLHPTGSISSNNEVVNGCPVHDIHTPRLRITPFLSDSLPPPSENAGSDVSLSAMATHTSPLHHPHPSPAFQRHHHHQETHGKLRVHQALGKKLFFNFWVLVLTLMFACMYIMGTMRRAVWRVHDGTHAQCWLAFFYLACYMFGQTLLLLYRAVMLSGRRSFTWIAVYIAPLCLFTPIPLYYLWGHQNAYDDKCHDDSPYFLGYFFYLVFIFYAIGISLYSHKRLPLYRSSARPLRLFVMNNMSTALAFTVTMVALATIPDKARYIMWPVFIVDVCIFLRACETVLIRMQVYHVPPHQRRHIPLSRLVFPTQSRVLLLSIVALAGSFSNATVWLMSYREELTPAHDTLAIIIQQMSWTFFQAAQLWGLTFHASGYLGLSKRITQLSRLVLMVCFIGIEVYSIMAVIDHDNASSSTLMWSSTKSTIGPLRALPMFAVLAAILQAVFRQWGRNHFMSLAMGWQVVTGLAVFTVNVVLNVLADGDRLAFVVTHWALLLVVMACLMFTMLATFTAPPSTVTLIIATSKRPPCTRHQKVMPVCLVPSSDTQ